MGITIEKERTCFSKVSTFEIKLPVFSADLAAGDVYILKFKAPLFHA
jgi:hypothetical protein